MKLGNNILFDIDVKGAMSLKKYFDKDSCSIYIDAPLNVIEQRLSDRNTETNKDLSLRLKKIKHESLSKINFDVIIENIDLQEAKEKAKKCVENFLKNKMNIGLFFGTFNPVHLGHIKIISNILQKKLFDQIWIILSPRSPHKKYNLVDKNERFHMLEIAFANYKKVIVSDVEFYLNEPNYTAITLDYLKNKYSKNNFSIIMGSDSYLTLGSWLRAKDIQKNKIYIYPRKNYIIKNLDWNAIILDLDEMEISSTLIREKFQKRVKDVVKYLNYDVFKYIKRKKLY